MLVEKWDTPKDHIRCACYLPRTNPFSDSRMRLADRHTELPPGFSTMGARRGLHAGQPALSAPDDAGGWKRGAREAFVSSTSRQQGVCLRGGCQRLASGHRLVAAWGTRYATSRWQVSVGEVLTLILA